MADNFIIARPYAKAIFGIAVKEDALQHWSDQLKLLSKISENKQTIDCLRNPKLGWHERANLFIDICEDSLDQQGKNLINILATNRRLIILPEVAILYEELRAIKENVTNVTVISANELTDEQENKLQVVLKKKLKRNILLRYATDKSVIGGLVLRIGDQVIDGTVRGKLNRLRKQLLV